MDVEYSRLASTIPLPEALEPAPKSVVRPNAALSYVTASANSIAKEENEANLRIQQSFDKAAQENKEKAAEDEGGLC
uniref:Gamma-soluble NSF attachment protein n=5 Tax=Pararge aegeria TaxID=116150 RepID=S4PDA9_9NEOP